MGFTCFNCFILGFKVFSNDNMAISDNYGDRIQLILKQNTVYIFVNHETLVNKNISIFLFK